jgi:DNA-binding FadR family transcriptional regulator
VKKGLLSRRIARDLELAIGSGELAPGSRMPAQRELATREAFLTSRQRSFFFLPRR